MPICSNLLTPLLVMSRYRFGACTGCSADEMFDVSAVDPTLV